LAKHKGCLLNTASTIGQEPNWATFILQHSTQSETDVLVMLFDLLSQ